MHKLLFFIFRISYIAINYESNKQGNYHRWSLAKARLNLKVNHAVLKYIGDTDCSNHKLTEKYCKQFMLDAVSEIISRHYKKRLKIYRFCQRLPFNTKTTFIILSVINVYIDETVCLLYSLANLRSRYLVEYESILNTVDLAIGFPEHSYAVSVDVSENPEKDSSNKPVSSFGDYLYGNYSDQHFNSTLISVGEYIRASKKKEEAAGNYHITKLKKNMEYPRIKATIDGGVLVFFSNLPSMVLAGGRSVINAFRKNNYILYEIKYFNKWAKSYNHKKLINKIVANNKIIRYIFVMPFSDIGLLKYDIKYFSKIRVFNYSSNIFVPPVHGLVNAKDLLTTEGLNDIVSSIPIRAISAISGHAVGFTDPFTFISDVKKSINHVFGYKITVEGFRQPPQKPVLLGYEVMQGENSAGLSRYIAIFDVPPESTESTLSRALIGDRTCDYSVITQFLSDCFNACISTGFAVVFKPKYSLSNYNASYQALIGGFRDRFGSNFIVASPYVNLISLLRDAHGSISIPYTSTKLISQALGKPSVYFMPEKYQRSFPECANNQDILFGEVELSNYLKAILEQSKLIVSDHGMQV